MSSLCAMINRLQGIVLDCITQFLRLLHNIKAQTIKKYQITLTIHFYFLPLRYMKMKNGSTLRTTKSTLAFNILNADAALAVIKSATTADVGALVQLLKHENAVLPLVQLLGDRDVHVRRSAIQALQQIDIERLEVVETLINLLGHWDVGIREDAIRALGEIGANAVSSLIQLSEHDNINTRGRSIEALSKIGPEAKAAVPVLIQLSTNEDSGVRIDAVKALAEIGPDAKEAAPVLRQLLEHLNSDIRKNASIALGKIEPEA